MHSPLTPDLAIPSAVSSITSPQARYSVYFCQASSLVPVPCHHGHGVKTLGQIGVVPPSINQRWAVFRKCLVVNIIE